MIKMLHRVMIASLFYMAAGSAQTTSVPTTATGVEHILQARRHLQDSTTMKEACDSSVESLESVFGSASASMLCSRNVGSASYGNTAAPVSTARRQSANDIDRRRFGVLLTVALPPWIAVCKGFIVFVSGRCG